MSPEAKKGKKAKVAELRPSGPVARRVKPEEKGIEKRSGTYQKST